MKTVFGIPSLGDVVNNCTNGKCSRCGSCCGEFLPVTTREVFKIKHWLEQHPDYKGHHLSWRSNQLEAICPFHNPKTDLCDIYEVRPYVCRDFTCCRKEDMIEAKRDSYAKRADYNRFLFGEDPRAASFHGLFFNDWHFDILFRHDAFQFLAGKLQKASPSYEDEVRLFPLVADEKMKGETK